MTSVIVPPVDLAPGMPSRVVTISATDITEGGQSMRGQRVTFALSDSLDVVSGGDVIAKTEATVVLDANGNGSIRLPVYSSSVKTWCGGDWAILVKGFGSSKAIRVPAGTSSTPLSALPNVRPLTRREQVWAVTGVGLTITEGTDWAGSATLSGGVLGINLTVPAAGSAGDWWRGLRSGQIDNFVTPGYQSARLDGITGTPTPSGFLSVRSLGTESTATISQRWEEWPSGIEWTRSRGSTGTWGAWSKVYPEWWRGLRSGNIDDYITPSEQSARLNGLVGSPSTSGFLTVRILGNSAADYVVQTWEEWPSGKVWTRSRLPAGTWLAWSPVTPDVPAASGADEHLVRVSELRRRRGPVEVATPGVVILALDHGLTNFKSKIWPLLQSRGLATTLAINSQNWAEANNAGATQADVKAWLATGLVEVANHGRTHTYPTTDAAWETEIRGGREELESQLATTIDTYQMAGSDWGSTVADLGRSGRGKIALGSHAIVTGMVNDGTTRVYPLDGHPNIGSFGYWIDTGGSSLTTARARVQDAITKRGAVIIRHHPQFLDTSGYITTAELTSFLDHLVTLRASGQITVLQQRDAMIATHA